MKQIKDRILAHSYYSKFLHWGKLVSQAFLGQVIFQLLGFAITLIIVRNLTKEDYAVYILLMSIQGMLLSLSGAGIMAGFQKIGGRVWNNDEELSSLLKTAHTIRVKLLIVALLVVWIYGVFVCQRQNIPLVKIVIFLCLITIIVLPDIKMAFLKTVFLLKKNVWTVQLIDIINQSLRFFPILFLAIICKKIDIYVLLFITIIAAYVSFFWGMNKARAVFNINPVINVGYKKEMSYYIRTNWHNSLFYAFKGQISIFLIAIFGSSSGMADLGALTRISMCILILSTLISNVFVPIFNKEQNKKQMIRIYVVYVIIWLFICLLSLILISLFGDYVLKLLGTEYLGLNKALFLVSIVALLNVGLSLVHGLNITKGWIKLNIYFSVPLDVLSLILGLVLFDFTQIDGVLYMSILTASCGVLLAVLNSYIGFKKYKNENSIL
ncbi:hypothetical protein D0T53_04785 [Dysgonomonas sp. 216]|uniref:lipopolysaccharide biosynthesis protein n=1 Tax=Dysgonomonas sp. 216 TaxID=2302934 RepID=UPI0013D2F906|nr:hypothetical protein [Dysgonomonas sp. 216]NDW18235.1 hypothetical protein [Dysgonomonas sp. 216]